ncbi:MAG: hypothetical protein KAG26_08410, partial [Methylococcales bacterium]|nr:hypothetical protein [Methylococcales bacterium]
MKTKHLSLLITVIIFTSSLKAQENYSRNPLQAQFVIEDVDRFWQAFDEMEITGENTFEAYIKNGTPGLQGFIDNRILGADSLYAKVQVRKDDYLRSRYLLDGLDAKRKRI